MKRHRNKAEQDTQRIKVWTHARAQQALPLIASVMQSVREHRLEAQMQHLRAKRLAARPGRPDRETLIRLEETTRAAVEADARFEASLEELLALNVYCLDPIAGLALIPFAHDNQLAWFVFDLFVPHSLGTWRYHEDPLSTRRPVAELKAAKAAPDSLIA
jgi:hypothetical protein